MTWDCKKIEEYLYFFIEVLKTYVNYGKIVKI